MLSIIIIDDSDDKVKKIKDFLRSFDCVRSDHVDIADSLNTGIDKLSAKQYDLAIVDLYLPVEKGDEPQPENGMTLIDMISKDDELLKPLHVVGLTRESYNENHHSAFTKSMWFLLNYESNSDSWKEPLNNLLNYMVRSKKMLQETHEYDYDVAIINALQAPEHYWLKKVFSDNWSEVMFPGDDCTTYYETCLENNKGYTIRVVACFANQMASTASATLTTKVINNFRPRYLFMTGIAAAVNDENVGFGDILVATEVWDGASGKIKDDKSNGPIFLPDPRQKALSAKFLNIIDRLKSNDDLLNKIYKEFAGINNKPKDHLGIHTGPMSSVPAVISCQAVIDELKKQGRKLLGIEMESYGMFYAAENAISPRPEIVASLKSVSDFATIAKDNDYQDYASYTSAALLKHIIENELKY